MILQKEIREKAQGLQVPSATIDKDWTLSHVLKGLYEVKEFRAAMVFKGGTCLKKCYFPDYRFSEDLDFTSLPADFALDMDMMEEVCRRVFENSGIRLVTEKISPQVFRDRAVGFEIKFKFWGANHQKNMQVPEPARWNTSIKFDVNWYEEVMFPVEEKAVLHDYSDAGSFSGFGIPCYSLKEILSEKLRALIQRKYVASRDYYDIWYLSQKIEASDWNEIVEAFHRKCGLKGKDFLNKHQMLNADIEEELATHWNAHLRYQIPADKLSNLKDVCQGLYQLFDKIF